jgi:DNA-binding NtrC family response regulator
LLDEVANMSTAAQAKLLRVLEDGQVTAVGSAKKEALDVRWLAATNVDLFSSPHFRHDVLQRLAGFVAWLPPLRERREDLGALTACLLQKAGITRAAMTAAAGRRFYTGSFPGNIRQLRNELRSAVALAGEGPIDLQHLHTADLGRSGANRLPESARSIPSGQTPPNPQSAQSGPSSQSLQTPEPAQVASRKGMTPDFTEISNALTATQGNVVRAASLLQTHPKQLYRWLDRLKIPIEQFRKG